MTRIAVIALIVVVAYWWLSRRNAAGTVTQDKNNDKHQSKNQANKKSLTDNLVRCAHCDVRIPNSHAVRHDGANYCSQAHAQADKPT